MSNISSAPLGSCCILASACCAHPCTLSPACVVLRNLQDCGFHLLLFLQAEGLVHVSNISSARLGSAKEAVERGQEVWVKCVSVSGGKLGLSIRDVDQATGRDLLDLDKIRAAQGTAGGAVQQQSALMGISGIKVNPKDFEETTKRWVDVT